MGDLINSGLKNDDDRNVRRAAAWALGNIGDTRAFDPLTKALKDKDPSVQAEAGRALEKIESTEKSPLPL